MRSTRIRPLISLLLLGFVSAVLATAQVSDPRIATPPADFSAIPADLPRDQPCPCQDGHWYDKNRKSCVTGACKVPGMPNGDKGGKYFAWDGNLFIDTPCKPCERLDLPLATGTAQWIVADGPDASLKGKPPVAVQQIPAGWGSIAGSKWVQGAANASSPGGDYRYELRFCLCPGFKNARLSLSALADNSLKVIVNGTEIGSVPGPKGFVDPPKTFSTGTQSHFKPGANVLTIVVNNQPHSPTGLLVGGSITADEGRCLATRR